MTSEDRTMNTVDNDKMENVIISYAKQHNIPISGIECNPMYDVKKGRVSKGRAIPHRGWNDMDVSRKKRFYQTKVDKTITGNVSKAWYLHLRSAGFYVIDVDTKNGKTAEEVLFREAYDVLYNTSNYVVRSGSGGLHFYFKVPSDTDIFSFKTRTKSKHFNNCLEDIENGDIDILFDSVITEGSTYIYENNIYKYFAIKGNINDVSQDDTVWENVIKECEQSNAIDITEPYQAPSSANELEDYLMNIPTKELSYNEWIKIAFAICNELKADGKELFFRWSETYPQNDYNETKTVWNGIYRSVSKGVGSDKKATFVSIKKMSREKNLQGHTILEAKYDKFNQCLIKVDESKYKSYEDMKLRFEENHFYFEQNNTIVRINEDDSMQYFKLEHAEEAFNTWVLGFNEKTGKNELFLTKWRSDPNRRIIRKLVYKKLEACTKYEYPLFRSFGYQLMKCEPTEEEYKEAIILFEDLVSNICKDEKEVTEYILNGFAHLIQKPFEKTGKIIAFASPIQGTGKDTVMNIIQKIVGNNFTAHYTSTEAYWEKHDTLQVGKGFVYLEEACSALNKAKANELKSRATTEYLNINPKGISGFTVPNIGRQYMTTNETEPFKIESSDRRGIIISPGTRLVKADWTTIQSKVASEWFLVSVGHYLQKRNISKWNPNDRPETSIYKGLKELAVVPEVLFLEQWESDKWVSASDLFKLYREYCIENELPHSLNVVSFGKKLLHHSSLYQSDIRRGKVKWYAPVGLAEEPGTE